MSLDKKVENTEDKETGEKSRLELVKQRFFELVDKGEYKEANDFFNSLNPETQRYVREDKMGDARLKEIGYRGW